MQRLKFGNILKVVPLLFLSHTRIASLTNYSSSKMAKIVVGHKIVSVRAEGYVSQQSSTQKTWRESPFHPRSPHLAVKLLDRIDCVVISTSQGLSPFPFSGSLQMVSWYWLYSFSSFLKSAFTLLHGHCTLLPFPSTLMLFMRSWFFFITHVP